MPNTFGNVTPPSIFLTQEIEKLTREFEVSEDIYVTAPVKMDTANPGQIKNWNPATDIDEERIGYSIHTRLLADLSQPFPYENEGGPAATVVMRGFMTVQVQSGTTPVVPGPVKLEAFVTNPAYVAPTGQNQGDKAIPPKIAQYVNVNFAGASDPDKSCTGWAMISGPAQGDVIEVVLR